MTSCRKCLNGALAETEMGPRQQPINLRAGSITSSVMMPRTPRVSGVGKTEQHRIARQVRIFDRGLHVECHPSHRRSDALADRVVVCKKNSS